MTKQLCPQNKTNIMQALAERLLAVAAAVHQELSVNSTDSSVAQWRTIIHGDFKTANLFFSPTAGVVPITDLSNSPLAYYCTLHCDADGMLCATLTRAWMLS